MKNTNFLYVVDDERVAREGVTMVLRRHYDVKAFDTAEAAIEAMKNAPPDLVLLDIGLPGMSGIEALKIIKRRYPEIIIMMITAYEDANTVDSAMKLGAYNYLIKPFRINDLIETIRNALETIPKKTERSSKPL